MGVPPPGHFPGKIDNKPLPGVFLEASFFRAKKNFKTVLRSIFVWRRTSRDFASRLAAKKLAPLANELVKLDSALFSMGFSGAFLIVVGAHVTLC